MLFQKVDEGGGRSAGDAGADFPLGKGAQGYAEGRSKLGLGEAEAAAQGSDAFAGGVLCVHGVRRWGKENARRLSFAVPAGVKRS